MSPSSLAIFADIIAEHNADHDELCDAELLEVS